MSTSTLRSTNAWLATVFAALAALALAACEGNGGSGPGPMTGTGGKAGPGPGPGPGPGIVTGAGGASSVSVPVKPGVTSFTTEEPTGRAAGGASGAAGMSGSVGPVPGAAPPGGLGAGEAGRAADAMAPGAPMGRVADVEEADIYKVDKDRLFYLNTYRGFMIYDVRDPKNPKRVSRLPVFGYPIEMFVTGNTVYALLRDALYLSQKNGELVFERHNVSQMVAIDISDLANPRVLQTVDIIGQLREGVSRKIENSVYVVSYIPQWYRWGWQNTTPPQQEQAWVYSFDVSDPKNLKQVGKLQIFEGGSINYNQGGLSYNRNFQSVAISATSNALMVVENWYVNAYVSAPAAGQPQQFRGCGSYESNQQAVVSIIDVSDPKGTIRKHTRFETSGQLTDQFKMTYVFDEKTKAGTFFGIFARQTWSSANCMGRQEVRNTIESWDITNGDKPAKLSRLDFGKPNETVRGTAFDVDRQLAYAITAMRVDPLYVINIADRNNLKILSAIDGLSGDMSVFRLIGDKKFLMGIGVDQSTTCSGFQDTTNFRPTKIAVSIIDVRDPAKARLVQRQCVAVKNADWVGSALTWNLDQAHKMIGMHSDATANVITVPVYYTKKAGEGDWWWYRYETAVGMMTWDLSAYDERKRETEQTVLQNFGTFVHPNGEVRRSIVFTHQGTGQRMMINLSDTHVSIANVQDLKNPTLESIIEVAPYYNQIYGFGDHLVEQVQARPNNYGPGQDVAEFRVKKAGGDVDGVAPVASFAVGQVSRVVKHGNKLVMFRTIQPDKPAVPVAGPQPYVPPSTEAFVYDLSNPARPVPGGRVKIPTQVMPYYRFYCGMGWWGGYWFDNNGSNWASTDAGLVFFSREYRPSGNTQTLVTRLVFLDLRDPQAPKVQETVLGNEVDWGSFGLVGDPVDGKGFFITYRQKTGETVNNGFIFTQYRYYAQRWELDGDKWSAKYAVNMPGRLVRTWNGPAGQRLYLTQDQSYEQVPQGNYVSYRSHTKLSLLRPVTVDGKPAAELRDTRVFTNMYLAALVIDGDKLFINGRPQNYGFGVGVSRGGPGVASSDIAQPPQPSWEETSDRLMIFDLAGQTMNPAYDRPTKAYNLQLMGTNKNRLFVNLQGDGILVVDVTKPAVPIGVKFLRTLGYATHMEFFGNDAYIASGYFGLNHLGLGDPADIPLD